MLRSCLSLSWLCVLVMLVGSVWAGPLDPPAAPAPSYKTLDEVEPRIPIVAADLPVSISGSGSYYLAESLSWTGTGPAITINANNVTLDLNGLTIDGVDPLEGATRVGISALVGSFGTIRNGRIRNMGGGGIEASKAIIEEVAVFNCRTFGITNRGGVTRRCVIDILYRTDPASELIGIDASSDGIVEDCIVQNVFPQAGGLATYGIKGGWGSAIRRCKVSNIDPFSSLTEEYDVYGIFSAGPGLIEDCHVDSVRGSQNASLIVGIGTGGNTTIRGNAVAWVNGPNTVHGISGGSDSLIMNNDIKSIFPNISGATVSGVSLGANARAVGNNVHMSMNTVIVSDVVLTGIWMESHSAAQGNALSMTSLTGSGHTVTGILANGDHCRIIGNTMHLDDPPFFTTIARGIYFDPETDSGLAANNTASQDIIDDGSNTLGADSFANLVY